MGWSDYSYVRYLQSRYEEDGPRVICEAEKDALSAKGWITEPISQNIRGDWFKHKDGRVAWCKHDKPSRIVCEYIGSFLAKSIDIPAPTIDNITYHKDGEELHSCLSAAKGETFQAFRTFPYDHPSKEQQETVCGYLALSHPFWDVVKHRDLHNQNVIVAKWAKPDGSPQIAAYGIDYAAIFPFSEYPVSETQYRRLNQNWVLERMNKFPEVSAGYYALGIKAVDGLTEKKIAKAVYAAYRFCDCDVIDFSLPKENFYKNGVSPEETIEAILANKENVVEASDRFGNIFFYDIPERKVKTPSLKSLRIPECA